MITGEVIANLGLAFKAIGWVFTPLLLLPFIYLIFPSNKIFQSIVQAIIRTIDSLSYWLGEITKWLLPILVLTVAFTVFALSIFGQSWTKLFESAEYLEGSAEADGIRGEYLLKTLIPIFAVTMILQGLAITLRAAMCLNGQSRPERPKDTPFFFAKQELEH